MRILIISDLHIGAKARCQSMMPVEETPGNHNPGDQGIRMHLNSFLSDLDGDQIDFILVGGDIADQATMDQYNHFDTFIDEICANIGLPRSKVLFTPGNHDVDWSKFDDKKITELSAMRKKARYDNIRKSEVLSQSLTSDVSETGDLYNSPYFHAWSTDELLVLSINTAAYDGPKEGNHPGSIDDNTFEALDLFATTKNLASDLRPKILLLHHHPIQYPKLIEKWTDFSILQSGRNVVEQASVWGFDLIIHGHRHTPFFTNQVLGSGRQIAVLACGSFSQNFPPFVYEKINNQFHILSTSQRDIKTGVLTGEIENYAFRFFDGWKPSIPDRDGIEHKLVFGPIEPRAEITRIIKKHLFKQLNANNFFETKELAHADAKLKYVSKHILYEILTSVCDEASLSIFGKSIDDSLIQGEPKID